MSAWYKVRREGSFAKPIAAVALACESQSTRSVRWSAAARQEARFTAVVVFPTPPFWLATAIIRAKPFSHRVQTRRDENLAKSDRQRKVFHVEH